MSDNAGELWNWSLIRKRCLREARGMLRAHHDAEEVVQEALTRAWRGRTSCRTPEAPVAWCLQITRHEALRLLGRPPARAEVLELEDDFEDQHARQEAGRALQKVDVDRALENLTPDERLLIGLRYEIGFTHPEIAARFEHPRSDGTCSSLPRATTSQTAA